LYLRYNKLFLKKPIWLVLCGEIISGYFGSPTKYITGLGVQSAESLDVTVDGICVPSHHSAFSSKGDMSVSDIRQNYCVLDRVVE